MQQELVEILERNGGRADSAGRTNAVAALFPIFALDCRPSHALGRFFYASGKITENFLYWKHF